MEICHRNYNYVQRYNNNNNNSNSHFSTVGDLRRLFSPHVNRIRSCLEPGLHDINWTNLEWRTFTTRCLADIDDFSYLMSRANDIYANRIEKLLLAMNSIQLHALPEGQPWTLEKFLSEIKMTCRSAACDLHRVSMMIEDAVEDLIALALQSINPNGNAALSVEHEDSSSNLQHGSRRDQNAFSSSVASQASSLQSPEDSEDDRSVKNGTSPAGGTTPVKAKSLFRYT